MKTIKIAVTGPEASGKTILAQALARYFACPVIEDCYEDFFLKQEIKDLKEEDYIKLAKDKLQAEKEKLEDKPIIVISDCELLTLKIWQEFKMNSYSENLKQLVNQQFYHLYLLTKPESKFTYPFKAEDPSLRNYFFNAYKKELDEANLKYKIIEGDFYERKKEAVIAIEKLFS